MPGEFLKYGGDQLVKYLHQACNDYMGNPRISRRIEEKYYIPPNAANWYVKMIEGDLQCLHTTR